MLKPASMPNCPLSKPGPISSRAIASRSRCPSSHPSVPKTGLPDFGKLTLEYEPDELCIELKSLKLYILAYRNLGIFYENVVNRVLRDVVDAIHPVQARVQGDFTPRGGLNATVEAEYRAETQA